MLPRFFRIVLNIHTTLLSSKWVLLDVMIFCCSFMTHFGRYRFYSWHQWFCTEREVCSRSVAGLLLCILNLNSTAIKFSSCFPSSCSWLACGPFDINVAVAVYAGPLKLGHCCLPTGQHQNVYRFLQEIAQHHLFRGSLSMLSPGCNSRALSVRVHFPWGCYQLFFPSSSSNRDIGWCIVLFNEPHQIGHSASRLEICEYL